MADLNSVTQPQMPQDPGPEPTQPTTLPSPALDTSAFQPPQPQVTQQPDQPQPFWKRVLQGALAGMAGGAGAHNWGQALGGGVAGELQEQQRQFQNNQAAQQNASNIRFRDAQDAYNAGMLTQHQQQVDTLTAQDRRAAQTAADNRAVLFQTRFGIPMKPLAVGSDGPDAVLQHLQQSTNNGQGGAAVSGWAVLGPDTMYVPDTDNEQGPAKEFALLRATQQTFGLPQTSRDVFLGMPRKDQMVASQIAQGMVAGRKPLDGKPYTKADESQLNADLAKANSQVATLQRDQNADPSALEMWQQRLAGLNATKAGINQANDDATNRQVKVANARGAAMNANRYNDVIDPNDGTIKRMTNAQQVAAGATSANGTTLKAAGNTANLQDIKMGLDNLKAAMPQGELTPGEAAVINSVIHGDNATARSGLLKSAINQNVLSPANQKYATALVSQLERQLSLRGMMSLGQGSEDQRAAIQNNLPLPSDTNAMRQQKMFNNYQQEGLLQAATPKVRGLNGSAPAPAAQPPQPATHVFSASAWQRANPNGDVNAAKAAAQAQNYQVVN